MTKPKTYRTKTGRVLTDAEAARPWVRRRPRSSPSASTQSCARPSKNDPSGTRDHDRGHPSRLARLPRRGLTAVPIVDEVELGRSAQSAPTRRGQRSHRCGTSSSRERSLGRVSRPQRGCRRSRRRQLMKSLEDRPD